MSSRRNPRPRQAATEKGSPLGGRAGDNYTGTDGQDDGERQDDGDKGPPGGCLGGGRVDRVDDDDDNKSTRETWEDGEQHPASSTLACRYGTYCTHDGDCSLALALVSSDGPPLLSSLSPTPSL